MKRTVGGICFLVVFGFGISGGTECEKPNRNTELCHNPTDHTECAGKSQSNCSGKQYSIANFPKGAVLNSTGLTKEELTPCYFYKSCFWNSNVNPPKCETSTESSTTQYATKTVVNENGVCPDC
jgi:hypothetical protein